MLFQLLPQFPQPLWFRLRSNKVISHSQNSFVLAQSRYIDSARLSATACTCSFGSPSPVRENLAPFQIFGTASPIQLNCSSRGNVMLRYLRWSLGVVLAV